jgi:hypothetical protein
MSRLDIVIRVRVMPDKDRITLVIEGLTEDYGQVRFNAFVSELQSLSATIGHLDRDANDGKPASYFRIVELSYSSPVRVVLEVQPVGHNPVVGQLLLQSLERAAKTLESGGDLLAMDSDLLEDFRSLARPVGKNVRSATLLFNNTQLSLTPDIVQRVDNALAITEECEGAIEGMLEQINVHQGANTFHIYPEIGPKKLSCTFPPRLYDDAIYGVGRRVEVAGTLKYRARATFPHQIVVSAIDVYPVEADLPDWEDLRGRAPDGLGGLTSEEFVRDLRDGWQ